MEGIDNESVTETMEMLICCNIESLDWDDVRESTTVDVHNTYNVLRVLQP
jgi:hypothetical protein